MPERIQLRRAAGWRKPRDAVVVSRPTEWGNPFRVGDGQARDRDEAVRRFRTERHRVGYPSDEDVRHLLAGRDLACWCPLDQPCHADVLLEIANRG